MQISSLLFSLVLLGATPALAAKKCSESHRPGWHSRTVIGWLKAQVVAWSPRQRNERFVDYVHNGKRYRVRLLTEEAFDKLPPGTILVDSRDLTPVVIGIDYLDLTHRESTGHLRYGFSNLIREQSLLLDPRIMSLGENYTYNPRSESYRASRINSANFWFYDFPPMTAEYLRLRYLSWRSSGGEWDIKTIGDETESLRVYFSYPENWSHEPASHRVRSIEIFLGWGHDENSGRLFHFRELARKLNLTPPTSAHPKILLRTHVEMERFFGFLTEEAGGREALIDQFNQHDFHFGVQRDDLLADIRRLRERYSPSPR